MDNFNTKFCGDPFWITDEFGNTTLSTTPRLTWCFQHAVLAAIPTLFLIVLSPVVILEVNTSERSGIKWNRLTSAKFLITCALVMIKILLLARTIWQFVLDKESVPIVEFIYPIHHVFTLLLLLYFSTSSRKAGITSDGTIFCTWLLFVLTGIPEFYTWMITGSSTTLVEKIDFYRYFLFLAWFPLTVLQLLLHIFPETGDGSHIDHHVCPESTASFLSRQFVCWFNPIVSTGYKKALISTDLFRLEHDMRAGHLFRQFIKIWQPKADKYHEAVRAARIKAVFDATYDEDLLVSDSTPLLPGEKGVTHVSSKKRKLNYGSSDAVNQEVVNLSLKKKSIPDQFEDIKPPSILGIFAVMFKWSFLAATFVKLISDLLTAANPLLLNALITFTENPDAPLYEGFAIAALMFVSGEFRSLCMNNYFTLMFRTGVRLQSVLTTAVFHKTLRLTNTAKRSRTVGEIVNLMAIDVERFQMLTTQCQQYWSTPLQIFISLFLLYQTIGFAFIAGVVVMLLMIPLNMFVSVKVKKWQGLQMKLKDERQKMTNEVLNGVKVIKLYAWEEPMLKVITEIRQKEMDLIKKAGVIKTFIDVINVCTPFFVAVAAFILYLASDPSHVMTPNVAFVSLTLFSQLRHPLMMVSEMIGLTVQTMISNKRLKEFFVQEELDPEAVQRENHSGYVNSVDVQNANFAWDSKSDRPDLKCIDLSVKEGSLVAIVGKVGSGKSSLLSAILGEMEKQSGYVGIRGRCAYASQQAWIQNMTLRDNIRFDKDYDPLFYKTVIDACELKRDFEILPHGDFTEIGEKGINLSGGQKARVSLARAIYQQADVYFLDDPLSAVDAIVGKSLFDNAIGPGGILKGKTRLLVTHSLTYLKECDVVVVMNDGAISHTGTFEELVDDPDVADIFKSLEELEDDSEGSPSDKEHDNDAESDTTDVSPPGSILSNRTSRMSKAKSRTSTHTRASQKSKINSKLIKEEEAAIGRVNPRVYYSYFRAMNLTIFSGFLLGFVLNSIASVLRSLWLTSWSDSTLTTARDQQMPSWERLGVYSIIGLMESVFLGVALFCLLYGGINASLNLHNPLLMNLMRSPLSFFDTTPLGRILNRTGKDMEIVDLRLTGSFRSLVMAGLSVVSTCFIISLSTPLFILVIIPMAFVYYGMLKYFIASSRQLQRLASITRSPLYAHFGETIQGTSIIRAFNAADRFFVDFCSKVDEHIMCKYHSLQSNRWLSIRLELLGNFIILAAAMLAVLGKSFGTTTAGVLGLSVSYSLNVTFMLNFVIRLLSEVETNIVAVERIKEYSITPTEASWHSVDKSKKPPEGWPSEGKIKFEDYSTRYRPDLDLALQNLSANVDSCEKLGIAGRTGAGKSSLTLALFRILEPANGKIIIDGIDISTIGLHELRSRLTIIPQDAVLFSGSLRFNLDPFSEFNDSEVWLALEEAHLKTFVTTKVEGLEMEIAEGGDNISMGQRQLVCLARAILRRTKILILDEATASVDQYTDSLIQRTIRTKFSESTVVTIAHRVNTILDYDRIMVLNQGKLAEFDTPEKLLKNQKSIFAQMAKDHAD